MSTIDEFKQQGKRAFANKEYKKAAKIYRDAISEFGNDPVLFSNRSQCFLNLSDWSRAFKDASDGLRCNPDHQMRIKLLFRKGVASRHLKEYSDSIICFREVLTLDPTNLKAQEELKLSLEMARQVRPHDQKEIVVPMVYTDSLPEDFARIVSGHGLLRPAEKSTNSSLIEQTSEELFGKQQYETESTNNSIGDTAPEPTIMSPMVRLRALKSATPEQKQSAFRYVLSIDDVTLTSLFKISGVDQEFFDLFIEASSESFANRCDLDTAQDIIKKFKLMSTFNRFLLTISLCDKHQISSLLRFAESYSPAFYQELHELFKLQL